jgi:hypothetical protein
VHRNVPGNIIIFTAIVLLVLACDHGDNPANNGKYYTIKDIEADGVSSGSNSSFTVTHPTTKLTLTFDRDIPDLSKEDIRINAAFLVIKHELTKTDTHTYELTVTPGGSGNIRVGLDPYRGFVGWKAKNATVCAVFHFMGTKALTITAYNKVGGSVCIPEMIADIPVVSIDIGTGINIGQAVFSNRQLTSVSIPSGVNFIGSFAFANNLLSDVDLPENLSAIEDYTFPNNQLNSVIIPDKVGTIGQSAFQNNQLTSITIGNNVKRIGISAFANNQLTSVDIPDSVTSIDSTAFANNQLGKVDIPKNVTTIGIGAFANNRLESVTISDSVTTIRQNAFQNNKLTVIEIPDSIRYLSGFNDNKIENVVIPCVIPVNDPPTIDDFITIGINAFANNELTSVTISNGVIVIDTGAFADNKLTDVIIPDSVTEIRSGAFANNQLGIGVIGIPKKITTIGQNAFANNQLKVIEIPDSIRNLSGFDYNKLERVEIPEIIDPETDKPRGVIAVGISAFAHNELTDVFISESVTSIGANAFAYNKLENITIPDSVRIIGNSAFINNQLTSITIGANVQLGISSFSNGFEYAYNTNGRAAGTYTRVDTTSNEWEKEVDSD